jgi:ATP-dependent Clp protease ATP-binding subunit ClpC
LTADDVTAVLSSLTDIPAPTLLNQDQRQRIAHMAELIHLRIVGQETAVSAISQTVQMAYAGLKPPQRPIGSFLMLGPTGVGKTELARVLAEFLFGSQEAMLKFDMSEFMNAAAMTRLVGAPFGYIDSEHGGQLTEAVKKRPYSVILFDEIEKADLRVFDLLLQMMDDGRLTSGRGEVVRFSDCLILMTSNLTHEEIFEHFRGEFLNRIDHIVTFQPLSPQQLGQVMDILIAEEGDLLFARKGLTLDVTTPARNWLLEQNQHSEWGGRPLNRLIMNHIRAPLSEIILVHNPAPGQTVRVRLKKGGLSFDFISDQGGV